MTATTVGSRVAEVFDAWADRGRAEGMERGHERSARHAYAALAVAAGERYLDIGCGNGYSVRWAAADSALEAVGIDVSSNMIERARSQSVAAGLTNTSFECLEFPAATFVERAVGDHRFDAIFSMEVFYYLEDPHAAIRAVLACLKPGGRFACVLDHYRENDASHSWGPDLGLPLHLWSESEWTDALSKAGFERVRSERVRADSQGIPEGELTWEMREGSLFLFGQRPS